MFIPLATRNIILIIVFTLITTFSGHGQVQLEPACAESVEKYGVTGLDNSNFYWYFDHRYGQILDGDGTDTVTIHWGYPTGTIDLEVLEVTESNCSNSPSKAQIEIIAPEVDLGNPFPEICDHDTLVLDAGSGHASYVWSDGSHGQEYYASTSGQIWVEVTDDHGCIRQDTISLLVHPLSEVNIGYDGDSLLYCNQNIPYIIDPGDFMVYNWTTSSGITSNASTFDVYPATNITDTIILTVADYNNCPASDTLYVIPCNNIIELFKAMPNTITPNNDGFNDVWNIPYMNLFRDAVLEIFDRWGRLVFRTTNVEGEPWDGTSKGRALPMDSYYYVLSLNAFNTPPIVGTVNLIR
jgi:gliding motility-associated-like protein